MKGAGLDVKRAILCSSVYHWCVMLWWWATCSTALNGLNENSLSEHQSFFKIIFIFFLGPHPQHMEVSRLGVKLEPQLLAYTIATATPDLRHTCDLHHSSWQDWILNPLSESRDEPASSWTLVGFLICWGTTATPGVGFLNVWCLNPILAIY